MPIRTCVGCRTRRRQEELIRIVQGPSGPRVDPGPRGAVPGRGIYVCSERNCIDRALKGGLKRVLKNDLAAAEALRDELSAAAGTRREGNDGEAQGS